jgi:hypothetical protein
MSGTNTVLSYIGSVDTSSASNGTIMFSVNFNAAIAVLMFEYKYQPVSVVNPTPANLQYSGFIYPESAQRIVSTEGLTTVTYYVPVPVPAFNPQDSSTTYDVAIRVYDAGTLGVTNWSNALQAYNPPQQPLIETNGAYFDRGAYPGTSTLWINLDSTTVSNQDQFIVSYYYVPEGSANTTRWVVTELLTLGAGDVLTVVMDGIVSEDPLYSNVYVAVNAVTEFIQGGNTYYSISEISNTETAVQTQVQAPTLDTIVYNVYSNRSQTMDLSWRAPGGSFVPGLTIDHYDVYVLVNDPYSTPVLVATTPLLTCNVNVSGYGANDTLIFYVVGVLTSGTETPDSNKKDINIFYYAGAPNSLYYNWAVYESVTSTEVDVSFTFVDVTNTGSGTVAESGYVWQIQQNAGGNLSIVATGNVTYAGPGNQYDVIATFPYNSDYEYKVVVFLQTDNTNPEPPSPLDGASAISSTIAPSDVPFIYNIVNGANTLSYNVSSAVELAPTAAVFYVNASTGNLDSISYQTTNGSPVIVSGNYIYTFSFTAQFNFAAGKYTITASNQAGIGSAIVNNN